MKKKECKRQQSVFRKKQMSNWKHIDKVDKSKVRVARMTAKCGRLNR